jgi:hypothetical protein
MDGSIEGGRGDLSEEGAALTEFGLDGSITQVTMWCTSSVGKVDNVVEREGGMRSEGMIRASRERSFAWSLMRIHRYFGGGRQRVASTARKTFRQAKAHESRMSSYEY